MPPPRDAWNPIQGPGDYDLTSKVHNSSYAAISSAQFHLAGKAALIIGGTKGIGRATVLSFARAGVAYLAFSGRSAEYGELEKEIADAAREAGKEGPKSLFVRMDVVKYAEVEEARRRVEAEFGRLDVLVNNAGALSGIAKVHETDPEVWWSVMETNVRGPYNATRAFLPLLLASPQGLKMIVNVASVGAHVVMPTLSAYQTSKLAVVRFTEFVAKDYAAEGLTCLSIHPGNIATGLLPQDEESKKLAHIFTETPDLPGDVIVFLTAQEDRHWLSGRYVNVTWDIPEFIAMKENIVEKDLMKPKLVWQ